MLAWKLLRLALYGGFTAAQLVSDTYDRAARIGRRLLPRKREDSHPLSWKYVEHQQEQIRHATMRPPPHPRG